MSGEQPFREGLVDDASGHEISDGCRDRAERAQRSPAGSLRRRRYDGVRSLKGLVQGGPAGRFGRAIGMPSAASVSRTNL